MKTLFAGIALFGTFALASAQTITFDKTTFDYGAIKPNADGTRFFNVTNTGDKPLIISNVKPSCGCTTPEFSQDPILPGKSAKIKVGYNTATPGAFNKMIEVFSNDPVNSRSVIYIKGDVNANAPEPKVLTPAEQKAAVKAEKKAAKTAKKVAARK
ncbi:DUF1573 domain-containing protein [Chryseobacterium chendengshani]|uniref:DUF1573 domain-containing protein n=1 Tax=unclassified Chryseobacterium TaxID=2593645 RepID=UPI001C640DB0|nr:MULTISPECIES: DUF1573 domain-containing protein [unclassified Chryseobacterium]MBW7676578.1 DUF1573 domain-containing protein [Chryseobacterium sp. LJ756]MBW8523121.1 DUF1573 domain-containing protein [Chryseobacterium sp. LJ668]QYK15421.1 DUF1573 domain-containing protein [Chryseobacterium sp. LJ668]